MSNTGGAWDIKSYLEDMKSKDKKKYDAIMAGEEGIETVDKRKVIYAGKKSNVHAAAVVGDTVGDPLKDTSGPALNIVMKLMAIISVRRPPCPCATLCDHVHAVMGCREANCRCVNCLDY